MAVDIQPLVARYLTAFRSANGAERQGPSDFRYRNGWLTYRHYGVTHRARLRWLAEATERLEARISAPPPPHQRAE